VILIVIEVDLRKYGMKINCIELVLEGGLIADFEDNAAGIQSFKSR
jgi:hypothetical protein